MIRCINELILLLQFFSENAKVDVYAFLFDDMLLLTRFRKIPQKVNKVKRKEFAVIIWYLNPKINLAQKKWKYKNEKTNEQRVLANKGLQTITEFSRI